MVEMKEEEEGKEVDKLNLIACYLFGINNSIKVQ